MMYYGNVTFTMSLPRCRTAWITNAFANAGEPAVTMHDPLKNCASIDELAQRVDAAVRVFRAQPVPVIVCDTAAVFFYPQIAHRFPEARFLFIERPPIQVERSVRRAGGSVAPKAMNDAYLAYIMARDRAQNSHRLSREISHLDLASARELLNLWQFFGFRTPFPEPYFAAKHRENIQVPFAEQMRLTNAGKVERLMATRHEGW